MNSIQHAQILWEENRPGPIPSLVHDDDPYLSKKREDRNWDPRIPTHSGLHTDADGCIVFEVNQKVK